MYLRRKVDKYLVDWKNDVNHKPLVIKGLRQVGKTKAIKMFAYNQFKNAVYINFIEEFLTNTKRPKTIKFRVE